MSLDSQSDFLFAVEDYIRSLAGDRLYADDYDDPVDMSSRQVGTLLSADQDEDFFIYVVDFDRRTAKVSRDAPKRTFGAIQLYYAVKSSRRKNIAIQELEKLCGWFADDNRLGARFRGINFTGQIRRRGFLMLSAEVPFEFDQFAVSTKGS